MHPLKRESPSHIVAPPVNLVLINPKKNKDVDEDNRRLIARVAPVCLAYSLHLWLVDFGIKETPIEFARSIAPSTSIGMLQLTPIELHICHRILPSTSTPTAP